MLDAGKVQTLFMDGIGYITFSHPKGNSLPGLLLKELAQTVQQLGQDDRAQVIVLRSEGEKVFCAGASFDELKAVRSVDEGHEFFMGFARLILAMRNCPKFVIARAQGKVVGGGVGIASAADYCIATQAASFRLSELALGLGPFVIGPAVLRKVGRSAFNTLSIGADWHAADFGQSCGLYAQVVPDIHSLDAAVNALAHKLAATSPEAMARLKQVLWENTDEWSELLPKRARISAELLLTDFCRKAIAAVS